MSQCLPSFWHQECCRSPAGLDTRCCRFRAWTTSMTTHKHPSLTGHQLNTSSSVNNVNKPPHDSQVISDSGELGKWSSASHWGERETSRREDVPSLQMNYTLRQETIIHLVQIPSIFITHLFNVFITIFMTRNTSKDQRTTVLANETWVLFKVFFYGKTSQRENALCWLTLHVGDSVVGRSLTWSMTLMASLMLIFW